MQLSRLFEIRRTYWTGRQKMVRFDRIFVLLLKCIDVSRKLKVQHIEILFQKVWLSCTNVSTFLYWLSIITYYNLFAIANCTLWKELVTKSNSWEITNMLTMGLLVSFLSRIDLTWYSIECAMFDASFF